MLVDTHCHFNQERLASDLLPAMERAQKAGVLQMIVVGYDMDSSAQALALAEAHAPTLFAAVGIHPHDALAWNKESERRLRSWLDHPRVVALGEIGLDYYRDLSPRPVQAVAFRGQLSLAREAGLPVIIHCREAYADTLQVLEEEGPDEAGGVMHCWAGTPAEAEQAVAMGFLLGFGGTLTFKNARQIRHAAESAPLEALLLETDAPYLAPDPYRGQRNEPAYTRIVAERLAELRGLSMPELETLTTGNAHRLFARMVGEG